MPWLGEPSWARFAVILVNVWYGAPFFMIMYLAALKSVPDQLYEAAAIDGATGWQKLRYVTLPMMRNIIAITVLFSLIVTFANFDIVRILTNGGPQDRTHVFGTYAFQVGIQSGDIPLGAAVSLFMFPILAVFAFFVLRGVTRRTKEMAVMRPAPPSPRPADAAPTLPQGRQPQAGAALGADRRLCRAGGLRGVLPDAAVLHAGHQPEEQRRDRRPGRQPLDRPQPDAGELLGAAQPAAATCALPQLGHRDAAAWSRSPW